MARRFVRPLKCKFKPDQLVVGQCDFIANATGVVVGFDSAMTLCGPFPDYALTTGPGVTIRVTIPNGDHQVGDLLDFHDKFVRLAG